MEFGPDGTGCNVYMNLPISLTPLDPRRAGDRNYGVAATVSAFSGVPASVASRNVGELL